jgi:hypothetical protein
MRDWHNSEYWSIALDAGQYSSWLTTPSKLTPPARLNNCLLFSPSADLDALLLHVRDDQEFSIEDGYIVVR